jgi:hypothetical protein
MGGGSQSKESKETSFFDVSASGLDGSWNPSVHPAAWHARNRLTGKPLNAAESTIIATALSSLEVSPSFAVLQLYFPQPLLSYAMADRSADKCPKDARPDLLGGTPPKRGGVSGFPRWLSLEWARSCQAMAEGEVPLGGSARAGMCRALAALPAPGEGAYCSRASCSFVQRTSYISPCQPLAASHPLPVERLGLQHEQLAHHCSAGAWKTLCLDTTRNTRRRSFCTTSPLSCS